MSTDQTIHEQTAYLNVKRAKYWKAIKRSVAAIEKIDKSIGRIERRAIKEAAIAQAEAAQKKAERAARKQGLSTVHQLAPAITKEG
jgi:hypothetical protein